MEIRLLLSHNGTVYDVSNVVVDGIRLTHSIRMEAGSLRFSVVRDGVMQFVEGDPLQLYVDGMLRFSGWVMTKERTSAQIITVTAYDMLFYLAKNRDTYVYWDKTATEVVRMIAENAGLPVGVMTDTKWKIPQRIEEGQTLLDMIQTALTLTAQATGREYFFYDAGGRLTLRERQELIAAAALRCDGGIAEYTYRTDISKDTYNTVKLYQAGRKETEHLAWQAEQADKVQEWGRLQYYAHIPITLQEGQLKEMAEAVLREKCRVQKTLTVENINGDIYLTAGQSVYLEIQDLAEIGIAQMTLIEACTHVFQDGGHRMYLEMRVEEST